MESPSGEIAYPKPEQIYEVNRRMIETYGGRFDLPQNLLNPAALEYVLAAISSSFFSVEPYPTLKDKAAALAYHIITRHVFMDGNKRTGVHISWEFLRSNGVEITLDDTVIDLAVAVADGSKELDHFLGWLHDQQQPGLGYTGAGPAGGASGHGQEHVPGGPGGACRGASTL